MKIFLKSFTIIIAILLITVSCREDSKVRFPDFQNGVNARVVVHSDKLVLNFLEIDKASLIFDVYSENKDIKEITYTVTYTDASFPAQKFPTVEIKKVPGSSFKGGKASDIELTAAELATAFNLPGGASYLSGGDNFTFFASVELTDGRIINAANSAPNIAAGTNSSFTSTFKLFVSCPFSTDEAAGEYTVVTDPGEWTTEADHQVNVIKGPGANQVTLKDFLGYPEQFDVIVDVDPNTGVATVAKQKAFDFDYWDPASGYGIGSVEGSGFFFSCTGFLTVNLAWTVSAGSFGTYPIEIQKN